jgi:arabinose-5-phosphate isomerase
VKHKKKIDKPDIELILSTARRTIEIESAALNLLASTLDDSSDFVACVKLIASSSGRLVLTGVGKSALIAQKIVSTLNSTGTPALFMHSTDALHGDLGMILTDDIILCLSKSGETPEIKALLPLLKIRGNHLIAMTSNRESTLAKVANFLLWTPVEKEADVHNLVPTTSTTSQLALGDALAVSLLALNGFTSEDFAKFHPGGALGKQLYLRVQDLYILHERPCVSENATIQEIISDITKKRLGATAVLDENGELLGIITDGDLRRMLELKINFNDIRSIDILNKNPKKIAAQALAADALILMRENSISQLIVIDNNKYVGMIHLHDLVREGLI